MKSIEHLELQEGDIIFTAIPNELYRRIAVSTGSKTSHVGILFKDKNSNWQVAESKVPFSKYSSLENFISNKRTQNGWFEIYRLKNGLNEEQKNILRKESEKHFGKFYNFWFRHTSKKMFCSKFVYEVYKRSLNIEVGKLETFKELFEQYPNLSIWFWRVWFLGFVPWKHYTITPESQIKSENLILVGKNK